jgi:hypothetical protein
MNSVPMVTEHDIPGTVAFKTFKCLKFIERFIVHSAACYRTVYAMHTYLTGVTAKAFSGNRVFQNMLNIFQIFRINNIVPYSFLSELK